METHITTRDKGILVYALYGKGMTSTRIVDRQWGMVCLERN
jgi:hypothetical protein